MDQAAISSVISLHIRKPRWAESIAITSNGISISKEEQDGYLKVDRQWKAGDEIEIRYVMLPRHEDKLPNGQFALFYGPWLLGVDKLDSESYFNEETADNMLKTNEAHLTHAPERSSSNVFRIPASHFSVEIRR